MTDATLRDAVILLGFALAFVLLFRKLGLGATLAFLVAGAVVGPQGLALVGDVEEKRGVAELGIVLLLFLVGLELSPARLWQLRQDILGLGALQVGLCASALAVVIWLVARFSVPAAIAVALPLALSSTAQVLPMLQSAGRLRTPFGERAFSILLFQDLSIVPLITIVAALSRAPAPADAPPGWLLGLYTVLAVAGLIAAGRFVLRPMFRLIGTLGEREMFVFAALFTVISAASVMAALGLSTALGAFVAGVMLADSPYRHQLEADVDPFRSVLLGLFFLSVGMMLDLGAIAARPVFVIGMAALLILTKAAIIMGIGLAFRMHWRGALALGLLLSQGGEFGFVLFDQARRALLIAPEAASLFGAIVTLSMATTPFLMRYTQRIRAEPGPATDRLDGPRNDGASAIVIGYGRFGQTVAQMLMGQKIAVTLIDQDVQMIDVANSYGAKVYYGDGTRVELLRQAGAGEAQLLLFCLDGTALDTEALGGIHEAFPHATIFVRAYDRRHMIAMRGAPIEGAVREVMESAIVMARQAMESVGVDAPEIAKSEADYRKRDLTRLNLQGEAGDLHAGREMLKRLYAGEADEAAAKGSTPA